MATERIYNVGQVAKFFVVSQKTVRAWCQTGKLPAFKIGKDWKVRVSDLQKLLDRKVRAAGQQRDASLF